MNSRRLFNKISVPQIYSECVQSMPSTRHHIVFNLCQHILFGLSRHSNHQFAGIYRKSYRQNASDSYFTCKASNDELASDISVGVLSLSSEFESCYLSCQTYYGEDVAEEVLAEVSSLLTWCLCSFLSCIGF